MAYEDTEDYKNLMKAQAREDADANEPGTESTAAFMKRTGTKANRPKATVGGPKIVTKEQMKKAGFDNLRDYLNAQKGLKRRDNFASEAQKRLFATGARGTQTEGSAGEAEARAVAEMRRKAEMPGSKEDMERDAREQAISGGMKKGGKVESKLMKKEGRGMAKATMQKVASKVVRGHEKRMHKMNSGGSIDGIALRGKTRGRMV